MTKDEIKTKLDKLNSDIDATEKYTAELVLQRKKLKYDLAKIKADEIKLGVWYDITDREDEYTPSIYYFFPLKRYYDRLYGTMIRKDGNNSIHITFRYVIYDVDDLTKVVPTEDVDNLIKVFNDQIYHQFDNEEKQ
jgi:hypothetical protein